MKKYQYHVEEYSQDSRIYLIESDRKLTEEEIYEAYPEVDLRKDSAITTIDGIKVTFQGTEYGDDSQVNIKGELKNEV